MNTTVRQLAEWVHGEVVGDGNIPILAAKPLSEAGPGDITFVDGERNLTSWQSSPASAAVVSLSVPINGRPLIRVADPLTAFASIVLHFRGSRTKSLAKKIDAAASIHPSAKIGDGTTIAPFAVVQEGATIGSGCEIASGAVVGRNCKIGDDVVLHPNVVLYEDTIVGNRVIIHANTVIGADGFGYRTQEGKHVKVPQLGHVDIGDDVEIGACATIDRGTFGPTRIGAGTKIDNLVMIAHNCQIGRHNMLVSQVGIAGSSITGEYVVMAGQVGIGDHVRVGDRSLIGPQAGVVKDVPPDSRMHGGPARPDKEALRILLALDKLPDVLKDVRKLKQLMGMKDEE